MAPATGRRTTHWTSLLEPALVFALIMLYIWWLRSSHRQFWVLILALVVFSHHRRREKAGPLGLRWANFVPCAAHMAPAVGFTALALLGAGMLFATLREISFDQGLACLAAYCPWGVLQQYLLNGYFANRFAEAWPPRQVPLLSAAIFSGVHLPNWFLMTVCFAGGYACTWAYQRHRNVLVLGLAHAIIGFVLFLVVPDSISRNLRVGPGWFR